MAIRQDVDEVLSFLNEAAKLDPVGMGKLLAARVPCNDALAQHPTIQVAGPNEESKHLTKMDTASFGVLGLLNGYFGSYDDGPKKGWGPITAIVEDDGSVSSFVRSDLV